MDKFLRYFENQDFLHWVLKPDDQLENFWKNFLKDNPSEKEEIDLAKLIILQFESKKEADIKSQSLDLFSEILKKLEQVQKKHKKHRIIISLFKYAAVALLSFSLGIAIYYFQKPGKFEGIYEQIVESGDENYSRLILGTDNNIPIFEKKSAVVYHQDGKIIINNHDTISPKTDIQDHELNQLVVPYGMTSSIRLPDGTKACLNAGSRLVYPSFFKERKREVFLIGEGFFEVAPDKEMPFIVQTKDLDVEVVGTKFNLTAYPSDNYIETTLVEGIVTLKEKGYKSLLKEYSLEPDQLAVFNRTSSEIKISEVEVINYIAWHEGFLNFESSDLSRIARKLERYYDIKINFDNPMLGVRSITGKLILKEEKEKVLGVLAKTASAELVKINEKNYVIK